MKQFFVMLAFLSSLWVSGQAKKVSPEQARQKAFSFLKANKRVAEGARFVGRNVNDVRLCHTSVREEAPTFYVFNAGSNGFVIVSAEDRTEEILGYSTNGQFDEDHMPDGLRELLQDYARQIAAISAQPEPQTQANRAAFTGTKVIETAQWNQGEPYNMYCPKDCPAGCVPVAVAIVMRHYGHPTTGLGLHSYKEPYTGETLSADFSTRTYDWNAMPLQDAYDNPNGNYKGVARLIADIGIASETSYSPDASSTNMGKVQDAMVKNFVYSPKAKFLSADDFSAEEWSEKLREEIDSNRVILYSASLQNGDGHCFVVDGYRDDLFSINWGWGGVNNGFYTLGGLQSGDSPSHPYTIDQSALLNIMPSDGTEDAISPCVFCKDMYGYSGINANWRNLWKGETYQLVTGNLTCAKGKRFKGQIFAALFDKEGKMKELISVGKNISVWGGAYYFEFKFDCKSSVNLESGDYVAVVSRDEDSDVYLPIADEDLNVCKLSATSNDPITATVKVDCKENVTFNPCIWNVYHYSKPLVGYSYRFKVVVPGDVVKTVVRFNGEPVGLDSDGFYKIERIIGDGIITIKTYTEAELMPSYHVHLFEAGTLEKKLQGCDLDAIKTIVITGSVDQRDFVFLNSNFTDIDMRATNVRAYGNYPANTIPRAAFVANGTLTRIILPASIMSISEDAFKRCSSLTEMVIPAGVVRYGVNAFNYCRKLKEFTVLNPIPVDISWCVLVDTMREYGGTLHVPVGAKAAYEAADEWNLFSNIVEDAEDIYVGIESVRESTDTMELFSLNGNTLTSTAGKSLSAYDMAGRRVAQGATLTLKSGAYIVVCGNSSAKVLVK